MNHNAYLLKNSLEVIHQVFEQNRYQYRVLGSTLIAAISGKPHRQIGDIDIIIDKRFYPHVKKNLINLGFSFHQHNKFAFSWQEATKPDHLPFTFILLGNFSSKFFTCSFSRHTTLKISTDYLAPTQYSLFGYSFTGIPYSSIFEGIKISHFNPKRTLDKQVFLQKIIQLSTTHPTINNSFQVSIFGIKISWLYLIFSYLYNLFGALRVRLGKKYEIW